MTGTRRLSATPRSWQSGLSSEKGADRRALARELAIAAAEAVICQFRPGSNPATGPIDVVDLFSGCGGLSTGFEFVGRMMSSYRLAAAVDFDPHAVGTYAANLP